MDILFLSTIYLICMVIVVAPVVLSILLLYGYERVVKKQRITLTSLPIGKILVVSLIIGIGYVFLVITAGSSQNGRWSKARDARRMSDMRQLITAQESYGNGNGSYVINDGVVLTLAIGSDLSEIPMDPTSGHPYSALANNAASNDALNLPAGAWFCYYATLENPNTTASGCGSKTPCKYYTASQAGNFYRQTPPKNAAECSISN